MQDLSKYSIAKLRALELQVIEELRMRHFLSVSQAREQILHIANGAGIPLDELRSSRFQKPVERKVIAVKFRNPNNPSQQWTGRGRQPRWVKDWVENGHSLDQTRV